MLSRRLGHLRLLFYFAALILLVAIINIFLSLSEIRKNLRDPSHRPNWGPDHVTKTGFQQRTDPQSTLALDAPDKQYAIKRSMSACLLVMDDNHFLIEWLAYHYHTLPLRRLILAVDPRSSTSPSTVLGRWNGYINITEWKDDDYISKLEHSEAESYVTRKFKDSPPALIQHRVRQRLFFYHCLRQLKHEGQGWTVLADSDEYLRINYETIAEQGHSSSRPPAPPISEPGSVLRFLNSVRIQRPGTNITSACAQVPRRRFGPRQNTTESELLSGLVDSANSKAAKPIFQTLTFRTHAKPGNHAMNKISKALIDLANLDWSELVPVESPHLPLKSVCARRQLYVTSDQHPLLFHHYIGTWKQYSFRSGDSRAGRERSADSYNKAARQASALKDENMLPWLRGFIASVGKNEARRLLQGVGEVG